jgi:hypothetical protein
MTIEEIKKAIVGLPLAELEKLRIWLQIERDARAGKFDGLMEEAPADYRNRRTNAL